MNNVVQTSDVLRIYHFYFRYNLVKHQIIRERILLEMHGLITRLYFGQSQLKTKVLNYHFTCRHAARGRPVPLLAWSE